MDIESLVYFKETTKDLNITKTAQRLFMSQQTLSNHISRLEEWCGAPLFYRKPKLTLTDVGYRVLDYANKILTEEQILHDDISSIIDENHGTIKIGASFLRSNCCLPHILPLFSELHPGVTIDLVDGRSVTLLKLLQNNEIDMAITVTEPCSTCFKYNHVLRDKLYLCVSDRLLYKYYPDEAEAIKQNNINGVNLKNFASLPFVLVSPPNLLEPKITNCFDEAHVTPKPYLSATVTHLAHHICSSGMAAAFLTSMPLKHYMPVMAPDINIFPMLYKGKPVYHDIYISYSAERRLTKYKQDFIDILCNYLSQIGEENLSRCCIKK